MSIVKMVKSLLLLNDECQQTNWMLWARCIYAAHTRAEAERRAVFLSDVDVAHASSRKAPNTT